MYALQLIAFESTVTLFVENKNEAEALFSEADFGTPRDKGNVLFTLNEVVENNISGVYDILRMRDNKHVNYLETRLFLTEQDSPWKITFGRKVLASSKDFPTSLNDINTL